MENKIIEEIPITIKNQHQLLNLLSEGYKSLGKALMEYVDNSFDNAQDYLYDDLKNKYSRDILIKINIDRLKNKISIQDNCEGMDLVILRGLGNSINDSEKKRRSQKRAWVNGQFGLGAHAYRFFAQTLVVTTKKINSKAYSISIDKDSPNACMVESNNIDFSQGTLVELCNIEKHQMKDLKAENLKNEIEVYFEMLLRKNVKIQIIDLQNSKEYICEPFDYDRLAGEEIKKVITSWKVGTAETTVAEENGIIVNLKICTEKINRAPFFARKGRRINYISHLDSFMRKTEHRKKVWENYYLTGYIEVQENLEPVITRDDFVGGIGKQQQRTGIYNEIIKLEDDIYAAIEIINKDKTDASLKNLADKLTELLSQVAKEEEIRMKYDKEGKDEKNKSLEKFNIDPSGKQEYKISNFKPSPEPEPSPNPNPKPFEREVRGNVNIDGEAEGTRIERQKQGIKIEFSTLPSDERSHCGDGIITIFTEHPDFSARKGSTMQAELGSMKITARLANYLSAVISSEFKEIFYQQKKLEPNRKLILNEQIDFIFKFEEKMKDFVDQPLSSLGELKK